jgi:hypothetical protein
MQGATATSETHIAKLEPEQADSSYAAAQQASTLI